MPNSGPEELYKFRPYATEGDRARVREILVDSTFYFPRRSQLNDPYDMAPIFSLPPGNTDDEIRRAILLHAEMLWKRGELPAEEIASSRVRLETIGLDAFREESAERAKQRLENYPALSLAGNRTHAMLWSHYASSHTGIAIHVKRGEESPFRLALPITYQDMRPTAPMPIAAIPDREFFRLSVLTKGTFWKYEDEYRFVHLLGSEEKEYAMVGLHFNGQKCRVRADLISGITVGCVMRTPEIKEILRMVRRRTPPCPVWRAKMGRSSFNMEFELLWEP